MKCSYEYIPLAHLLSCLGLCCDQVDWDLDGTMVVSKLCIELCVVLSHDMILLNNILSLAHKPNSNCATNIHDDADDIVFEVLPSQRPQDMCSFDTMITLDTNLECLGTECGVSTVRVVEVVSGEYIVDAVEASANRI